MVSCCVNVSWLVLARVEHAEPSDLETGHAHTVVRIAHLRVTWQTLPRVLESLRFGHRFLTFDAHHREKAPLNKATSKSSNDSLGMARLTEHGSVVVTNASQSRHRMQSSACPKTCSDMVVTPVITEQHPAGRIRVRPFAIVHDRQAINTRCSQHFTRHSSPEKL